MTTTAPAHLRIPQIQLSDRLRRIRRDEGLSQDSFAARLGIQKEAYSTYESGRNRPSDVIVLAQDIERVFSVPAWWTLGLDEPIPVTRQSLSQHIAPVVSISAGLSGRRFPSDFIPSQQAA